MKTLENKPAYEILCPECDSTEISADATVVWNVDMNRWELFGISQTCHCEDCHYRGLRSTFENKL